MQKPFFVYGSLKPTELAFLQVNRFVIKSEPAKLPGYKLFVRDLLAIAFKDAKDSEILGSVLHLNDTGIDFLRIASNYEGKNYELTQAEVILEDDSVISANLFVGLYPGLGSPIPVGKSWSVVNDSLLADSFPTLMRTVQATLPDNFEQFEAKNSAWESKNRRFGNFLLLTAILEHIYTLCFGGIVENPNQAKRALRELDSFKKSFQMAKRANLIPEISVNDYRSPDAPPKNTSSSRNALDAWTAIRNNMLHRGKSGSDTEMMEDATIGLSNTLYYFLSSELPHLKRYWDENYPDLAPIKRSYKS